MRTAILIILAMVSSIALAENTENGEELTSRQTKISKITSEDQCKRQQHGDSYYIDDSGRRVSCDRNYLVNNNCRTVLLNGGFVQNGAYYDHRGQRVDCNDNYYGHNLYSGLIDYYYFYPYAGITCSIYNNGYEVYYRMQFGYGLVCVGYSFISQYLGSYIYSYDATYGSPTYLGCRVGVDPGCTGFSDKHSFGLYLGN